MTKNGWIGNYKVKTFKITGNQQKKYVNFVTEMTAHFTVSLEALAFLLFKITNSLNYLSKKLSTNFSTTTEKRHSKPKTFNKTISSHVSHKLDNEITLC